MRQITRDAGQAIHNRQPFKRGNTTVKVDGRSAKMRLHGHVIAEFVYTGKIHYDWNGPYYEDYHYSIDSCGYMTHTTKERLNGIPGIQVVQRKGVWYLNGKEWDGSRISVYRNTTHDFYHPYILYGRLEE